MFNTNKSDVVKPRSRSRGRLLSRLLLATALSGATLGAANAESITFWTQPHGDLLAFQDMYDTLRNEFREATGHEVTVEIINWSQAFNTWLVVAQGGAAPDCASMYWLHSFVGIGGGKYGPMPITDYRDQWPTLDDDFYTGSLVDVHWDGEWYGVPWRVDIRPLAYRTDFFEEAGIESAPETWDDLVEYGKQLTVRDDNGNVTRWGFNPGNTNPAQTLLPYYWQAGGLMLSEDGKTATIDNDAMRTALKFLQDAVHVHKITSPDIFEKSTDITTDFTSGQVAINGMANNTWGAQFSRDYPEMDGKWAYALNAMGPANRDSYSGAGYWGVVHGTDKVDTCIEWIKFLSSEDTMQTISETAGTVSPRRAVMQSEFWSDEPWKAVMADTLNYGHTSQHATPVWTALASPEPGAVLYDLVYSTVIGNADIDAAVTAAQERMQTEMDRASAN